MPVVEGKESLSGGGGGSGSGAAASMVSDEESGAAVGPGGRQAAEAASRGAAAEGAWRSPVEALLGAAPFGLPPQARGPAQGGMPGDSLLGSMEGFRDGPAGGLK